MFIKKSLTGKLAVGGQKFIYCAQFGENVQKLSKSGRFQNSAIFEGFGRFLLFGQENIRQVYAINLYCYSQLFVCYFGFSPSRTSN